MPTQAIEASAQSLSQLAQGHRGKGELFGRVGGISRQPGNPHHAGIQIVEGLEGRVIDGPVVGHAVEGFHAKVRGVKPRKMRRIENRAAPHGIEVRDLDGRVAVVDRVVFAPPPPIGA